MSENLPPGVTPEMAEAIRRGEDVRFPDGTPVPGWWAYAPLSGAGQPSTWDPSKVQKEMEDPPTSVTLSPDYSALSPLWPLSDATDALVPEPLLARLIRWQEDFDANFRWDSGWRSDEAKARWADEAVSLEADLRVALEGKAEVDIDLWPLNPGFKHTWQLDEPPAN